MLTSEEKKFVVQQWNVTRQHLTLEEKKLFNSGMLHVMLTLEEKKFVVQQWNVTRHVNVRREKVRCSTVECYTSC